MALPDALGWIDYRRRYPAHLPLLLQLAEIKWLCEVAAFGKNARSLRQAVGTLNRFFKTASDPEPSDADAEETQRQAALDMIEHNG